MCRIFTSTLLFIAFVKPYFVLLGKSIATRWEKVNQQIAQKRTPRERLALSVLYSLLESGLLAPVCFPGRLASLVGDPAVQSHSEMGAQRLEHLHHDHQNHH